MTMILIFMFVYVIASAWDVGHINSLFDRMVAPGPRKPTPEPEPAPRLVINLPPSHRPSS